MKILHCCLAAFYIDNYGYQENILPKHHKLLGNNVLIVASTETYINNSEIGYVEPSSYLSRDKLKIVRLPYINYLPKYLVRKLRIYSGINKILVDFNPDIIFIHDLQFLSIRTIAKYASKNEVKIFIDCHTDFINSGRNWFSKYILHKYIYGYCAKLIANHTNKFYGTLPLRCEFLNKQYSIPKDKIELLPFGVDDSLFSTEDFKNIRNEIRFKLRIDENDFLIISGGKIDKRKNIVVLLKSFLEIKLERPDLRIKLLLFGKPSNEMKDLILNLIGDNEENIYYIDWISANEIYKYFVASDLAVFPGTHSVLWEEAVGLGLPCIFKMWKGMSHLNLGGNCVFINPDIDSLKREIYKIVLSQSTYKNMRDIAQANSSFFYYSRISKQIFD